MTVARSVMVALTALTALLAGCEVDTFCLRCDEADAGQSTPPAVIDPTGTGDGGADPDASMGGRDGGDDMRCQRGAEELCNGFDDDCDRVTDEGFDLDEDPRHCGECGNACTPPNADGVCTAGVCGLGACFDGFADLNDEDGCEYRCPVFPVQGEVCNGLDDDCDGIADEPEELPAAPSDLCKDTAGTPCAGTVPVCEERNGTTTWYCAYGNDVEFDPDVPNGIVNEESRCDGLDGDCDGVADDSFAGLGTPCSDGVGACQTTGMRVCNTAGDAVVCNAATPPSGSGEVCNGLDDDCDGDTDEDLGETGMVRITKGSADFWIDTYEASRPGPGSARTCTDPARAPWVNVTHTQAAAACAAAGKRLCTEDEWQLACEANPTDDTVTVYPYGNSFVADSCNVSEYDPDCADDDDDMILPTGAPHGCPTKPAQSACVSAFGVFDLSGNVREWTSTEASASPLSYRIRGGSAGNIASGTTCGFDFGLAEPDFAFENLGFRCCKTP